MSHDCSHLPKVLWNIYVPSREIFGTYWMDNYYLYESMKYLKYVVLIQLHNYHDTRCQREIYMKERNILLHPLRSIQDNWRSNFTHLSYVSPFGNSYTEFHSFIGIKLQFFNPSGMFVAHFPTNIFIRFYLYFL